MFDPQFSFVFLSTYWYFLFAFVLKKSEKSCEPIFNPRFSFIVVCNTCCPISSLYRMVVFQQCRLPGALWTIRLQLVLYVLPCIVMLCRVMELQCVALLQYRLISSNISIQREIKQALIASAPTQQPHIMGSYRLRVVSIAKIDFPYSSMYRGPRRYYLHCR